MPRRVRTLVAVPAGLALALAAAATPAQQTAEKKDPPRVTAVTPLAARPGATTKITVRGLKLDAATAIRFHEPKTVGKLLSKARLPGGGDPKEIAVVGDTKLEA